MGLGPQAGQEQGPSGHTPPPSTKIAIGGARGKGGARSTGAAKWVRRRGTLPAAAPRNPGSARGMRLSMPSAGCWRLQAPRQHVHPSSVLRHMHTDSPSSVLTCIHKHAPNSVLTHIPTHVRSSVQIPKLSVHTQVCRFSKLSLHTYTHMPQTQRSLSAGMGL